jgi:hypothetical protein
LRKQKQKERINWKEIRRCILYFIISFAFTSIILWIAFENEYRINDYLFRFRLFMASSMWAITFMEFADLSKRDYESIQRLHEKPYYYFKLSKEERTQKWELAWSNPTCEYQTRKTSKDGTRKIVCCLKPILCPLWKCETCSIYILEKNPELISELEDFIEVDDEPTDLDKPIKIN